jgi:hypothetical protein
VAPASSASSASSARDTGPVRTVMATASAGRAVVCHTPEAVVWQGQGQLGRGGPTARCWLASYGRLDLATGWPRPAHRMPSL